MPRDMMKPTIIERYTPECDETFTFRTQSAPEWAQVVGLGKQGWSAYRGPDDEEPLDGKWGDTLVLLSNGTIALRSGRG